MGDWKSQSAVTIRGILKARNLLILTFVLAFATQSGWAQTTVTPANPTWKVGSDLDKFAKSGLAASFSEAELGPRLRAFALNQQAAIFLDRRIDPTQSINFSMQGSLEKFYWSLAARVGADVCRIEDFYYFGPLEAAAQLPAAINALKSENDQLRKGPVAWAQRKPVDSKRYAQPIQILRELAVENGFAIKNPTEIPHDVWDAIQLPATSLETRVGLLLIGFGKWYRRSDDGKEITIVDFPSLDSSKRRFEAIDQARQRVKKLKSQFPKLRLSATNRSITASGPVLEIARFQRQLILEQGTTKRTGETKVFSLTTKASRGRILATIAAQTKRKLKFDPSVANTLRESISIRAKDLTLEELVDEVLSNTSLSAEISDETITVQLR